MKSAFQIDEWLVDPESNSLSADGESHHLEPKVMKVLLHLAEHPNRVISKKQMIEAVWPDTFVSDDVLTRSISILRRIMEDDPKNPRYIQTVPKAGYRLVGEIHAVQQVEEKDAPAPAAFASHLPSREGASPSEVPPPMSVKRSKKILWIGFAALLAVLATIVFGFRWRVRHPEQAIVPTAFRILPFASVAGKQSQAAFSPDGKHIAFVSIKEDKDDSRIYVKDVSGSEAMTPLTGDQDKDRNEYNPIWSPDGTEIAFVASSEKGLGIYLAPSSGNHEPKRIFIPQDIVHWDQNALSWSPDGKNLVFPDHPLGQSYSSIYQLDVSTGAVHSITTPPQGWEGDMDPAYSPDGTQIAFIRASESAVRDIYWMPVQGGAVHQLTHDARDIDTITWSRDGNAVIFSSDRGGKFALWKTSVAGGEPVRLPYGVEDAYQPRVSPVGDQLAYTQSSALWSVVSLSLATPLRAPEPVISSTSQDSAPSFSPDGKSFAFQSWRGGNQEIWMASSDGTKIHPLTDMGNSISGSPSWAAHSNRIAFDSRPDGHSHIFVTDAAGGTPRRLTAGEFNDILPRWSADDSTIYFRSNRGGRWQVWKVPSAGGTPQPVTNGEAIVAMESPDSKWLYFTKAEEQGIWRMPVEGGQEEQILRQPAAGFWGYWSVTERGIYYLDASQKVASIHLYQPVTKKDSRIAVLEHRPPIYSGITVSRDEQKLYMTDERNVGSHITLVEDLP